MANEVPTAPTDRKRGAKVGVETENGWNFVSLDQWVLGPSAVIVLANWEAVEGAGTAWG